ncbi:MAG: TIGR04255 family protein [Demequina sp.]|nr:TIGR04255 family protein [Demequina sp.]
MSDTYNVYRDNTIKQVIARADFENPLTGLSDAMTSDSVAKFVAAFPRQQLKDAKTQQVTLTVEDTRQSMEHEVLDSFPMWLLRTRDGSGQITLCRDFLSYTVTSYTRFHDFSAQFAIALDFLHDALGGYPDLRRLGLRYIDHISALPADPAEVEQPSWKHLIATDLTRHLDFAKGATLVRSVSLMEFDEEPARIRLQFGIPNESFPEPVGSAPFLLDTDAMIAARIPGVAVLDELQSLNHLAYKYFERAITDDLRNAMGLADPGEQHDRS